MVGGGAEDLPWPRKGASGFGSCECPRDLHQDCDSYATRKASEVKKRLLRDPACTCT